MDATLSMDAMAPALSQKIKTSRFVSWGPWRAKPGKGGWNLQIWLNVNRGYWVSRHPSTVPPWAQIYLPNRLVNQTAKRLVEAQPSPLCLPGSGWTWSWKDIQPQTNDVRCQMRGQWSGVTKVILVFFPFHHQVSFCLMIFLGRVFSWTSAMKYKHNILLSIELPFPFKGPPPICTRWRSPCPGIHKNDNGPPPSRMIPKVDRNWPTWSPTVHIPNNLPDSFAAPHHNVTITWRIGGSVAIFTKESWHWCTEMQENLAILIVWFILPTDLFSNATSSDQSGSWLASTSCTEPNPGPVHHMQTQHGANFYHIPEKESPHFPIPFGLAQDFLVREKKYKKAMNSHHRRKNTKFQKFKIIDRLLEMKGNHSKSHKRWHSRSTFTSQRITTKTYTNVPLHLRIHSTIQKALAFAYWWTKNGKYTNSWTLRSKKRIQNEGHGRSWIIPKSFFHQQATLLEKGDCIG